MAVLGVHVLFHRPSEDAMVEDEVATVFHSASLVLEQLARCVLGTAAETYIAHDEILRTTEVHLVARDYDTLSRGCLSSQCPVGTFHSQRFLQLYLSTHCKDNGKRFVGILCKSPAQCALLLSVILERSHSHHLSASSSRGILSEALCRRECLYSVRSVSLGIIIAWFILTIAKVAWLTYIAHWMFCGI